MGLPHRPASLPVEKGESAVYGWCKIVEILLLYGATRVYKAPASPFRVISVEHHKLDAIDLRILSELQDNGRITNVELSRRAKITAPPCLRRMRALEKAGYIQGYHADLDAKALGFEVTGFVFVGLASQNDADLKHFEERVRSWPQVRECHMLSGEVDFLLKCVATDLSAFQTFITETLTAEKNVASVKTALVIHATKNEPGVPIDTRAG